MLIKRLNEQEHQKKYGKNHPLSEENKGSKILKKIEKHEKKWKMKFIKIWHYAEEQQRKID